MNYENCFFRRGLNPPHRVKSINMSTFTQDEVEFMKTHGNQVGFYH
jgi:Arf-GAP domain and FG repeat-containing protein 1